MKHILNTPKLRLTRLISPLFVSITAAFAYMASPALAQGTKYDLAYPRSGDERAKPSQIFDDGKQTYIQMRKGQAPFMVFAVTPSGQKKLNTRTDASCSGDCVVVDGTYEELMFTSEGFKSVARYAGARQNQAAGVQSYGAAQPVALYGGGASAPAAVGSVGSFNRFPISAPNPTPAAPAPVRSAASVAALAVPPNLTQQSAAALTQAMPPASTRMVLATNAHGNVTSVLTSSTGGFMPTLDGTIINPPIKAGYQPTGTWVKDADIAAQRTSLKNLGANGRYAYDYNYAKAQCFVDMAADIHRQRRNNGVTEWLLHSAKAHSNAAINNNLVSYSTPQLPGEQYSRQNQAMWRDIAAIHQNAGARCERAPVLLACASVQLLGAEFKRGENYPEDAVAYEQAAAGMIQQAAQITNACPPLTPPAPVMASAPAPMPAPQAAPPVQLKLTKDTLRAQNLFPFDSPTLTQQAKSLLDEFVGKVRGAFISISVLDVVGFTDRLGSAKHNQTLSEKRAEVVKNHLVKSLGDAGLAPTVVNARGEGATNPITGTGGAPACQGTSQTKALVDCLAPDRRVEINLTGDLRDLNYVPRSTSAAQRPSQASPSAGVMTVASLHQLAQAQTQAAPANYQPVVLSQAQASFSSGPSAAPLSPQQQLAALDAQRQQLANQIAQEQQARAAAEAQAQQLRAKEQAHAAALQEAQEAGRRAYEAAMARMSGAQAPIPRAQIQPFAPPPQPPQGARP